MKNAALTLIILFITYGCAPTRITPPPATPSVPQKMPEPVSQPKAKTEKPKSVCPPHATPTATGVASYYHDNLHGNKTASGEIYNKSALTAAHRNLKFGTKVCVTNLSNSRSVLVRINDRGPYAKGRIIDLSRAAAERIGLIKAGITKVHLHILP